MTGNSVRQSASDSGMGDKNKSESGGSTSVRDVLATLPRHSSPQPTHTTDQSTNPSVITGANEEVQTSRDTKPHLRQISEEEVIPSFNTPRHTNIRKEKINTHKRKESSGAPVAPHRSSVVRLVPSASLPSFTLGNKNSTRVRTDLSHGQEPLNVVNDPNLHETAV